MLACCLCKGGDATVTHLLQYCGRLLVTIVILVWHALVMPRMVVFILGSFSGPYGVSLWKNIRRGWHSLSWFIMYEIGDGSKVQFWLDCWCGTSSLAVRYPELYRISCSKEASVADLMRYSNGVLHWEVQFCREVHNRELEAFRSFINSIYSTPVRGIEEDKRCWLPCKSKGFTVSAYYHLLVAIVSNFSLGKAFGSRRSPLEWLFLSGQQPRGIV